MRASEFVEALADTSHTRAMVVTQDPGPHEAIVLIRLLLSNGRRIAIRPGPDDWLDVEEET